jgi:hypothetical protein
LGFLRKRTVNRQHTSVGEVTTLRAGTVGKRGPTVIVVHSAFHILCMAASRPSSPPRACRLRYWPLFRLLAASTSVEQRPGR